MALCAVSALAVALLYQLARGRYGWRVLAYWIVILAGLVGGEIVAEGLGWNAVRLGDLRPPADVAGAFAALLVLRTLGI